MNRDNLKKKLLRNLGANAYGQLITVAIQLISVPVFIHFWGVGLYGEWLILSSIPAYLSLSDVGFSSVAANDMAMRIARGDKQGALEVYQSMWLLICFVSTVSCCALGYAIFHVPLDRILSITHIAQRETQLILLLLVLHVLVGLQGGVLTAAYRSIQHFAYGTMIMNTIRLTEWLASVAIAIAGGGVLGVVAGLFFTRLCGTFVMWRLLRKLERWLKLGFKVASVRKISELLGPAVAFMAFPLGLALSLQGMLLVIGSTLGSAAVVIFTAYRTLTRLTVQIVTTTNQAVWPEISAAYGAGELELVTHLHRKGSALNFWVALTAVVMLGSAGEFLVSAWTRHAFAPNHLLLGLLLVTTFLNVLWQTSWVVLMATNEHRRISRIFVGSAIAALALSLVSLPEFGLTGAGLVLAISEVPMLFFAINDALKLLNDKWREYLGAVMGNPFRILN